MYEVNIDIKSNGVLGTDFFTTLQWVHLKNKTLILNFKTVPLFKVEDITSN